AFAGRTMARAPTRCLIVSDFNVANLQGLLGNDPQSPAVEAAAAPFGQVTELLVDARHECWSREPDAVIVWTQPQGVIRSFARLQEFGEVTHEELLAEVDQYTASLLALAARVRCVLVPAWVAP